jgi:serine/threonine protein kinase
LEKRPLPLSSSEALSHYREELTAYEITEILSFETVYYLGKPGNKAKDTLFDNEKGDYVPILGDHIAYRYETKGILGKGSFGVVLRCFDHKHKEEVAVKIIKNKKLFHQQGLVEVRVLLTLRDKDKEGLVPVVCLRSHFQFRHHLCLVFELLSISLYDYLKTSHFQPLEAILVRKIAIQLLKALIFIRKLRIIHCDLKPENILLRSEGKSALKVIDFGSSCFENAKVYSYIQSRFYRAPEVILGIGYTTSIDMWSFGCILAEIAKGCPVFPGESEKHQLALYMEVLGAPPLSLSSKSLKRNLYFEPSGAPKPVHTSKGRPILPNSTTLEAFLPNTTATFRDLVSRCLDWNPFIRISPEEALRHPWFAFENEETAARPALVRTQSSAQFAQTRIRKVSLLLT